VPGALAGGVRTRLAELGAGGAGVGPSLLASFQSKSMCQAFAALANRNAAELEMLRQEAMPPAAQVLAELGAAMEAGS